MIGSQHMALDSRGLAVGNKKLAQFPPLTSRMLLRPRRRVVAPIISTGTRK